ncbi:hypothetical protein C9374_004838 [Naegleria lovaniensis]|uniref:Uncharacterized protein n=1 Tax=Naegleria lovaniensis TaxID=51637 RepID=A0AA88GPG5_NAELO|nr:uncharacterized protein C9374_004838 [Naegleria lovaniensis]KAG2382871.1 hypothetical protein C9374_004838 [Naegleria lovaniensis]
MNLQPQEVQPNPKPVSQQAIHHSDGQMIYVCSYQSIAYYAPLEDDSTTRIKENRGETSGPAPLLIPCKLPSVGFERIKKVMCSMNYVRVLSEEGRVFKIGFDLGISKIVYEQEIDTYNLFIDDMSCFTYGVLYLARERTDNTSRNKENSMHKKLKTYLYGGCKNFFNNLGVVERSTSMDEEDFRLLYTPEEGSTITHIASAFSFSICVLNRTDIHCCSTSWEWSTKQFSTPKPIIHVACSGFFVACILQDFTVLVANSEMQIFELTSRRIDRVFGGYDSLIFRAKSNIPSVAQYLIYNDELQPLSNYFPEDNWTRQCHWSEIEFEYKKEILMLNFRWDRPYGFYFVSTSENESNKFVDLGRFFQGSNHCVKCSFTNHTVAFYIVPPKFDLGLLLRNALTHIPFTDVSFVNHHGISD